MGRTPHIPAALKRAPFSLAEAESAGLSKSALRGRSWRRLGPELYCWTGLVTDPWMILSAWQRQLPADSVLAGRTAAWAFGLDFDPLHPIELIVPSISGVRSRPGFAVRRCDLPRRDVTTVRGLAVTTVQRTLLDLCLQFSQLEALVAIDAAMHAGLADAESLQRYATTANGRAGSQRLRSLAGLGRKAESPMETRLRWLLLEAGLPHPEVQSEIRDCDGRFLGRADLYYPASRLVIEFDGGNHRDRLVEDDRRQNSILAAGFGMLRFTTADVRSQPDVVVARVRRAIGDSAPLAPTKPNLRSRRARLDTTRRNWSGFVRALTALTRV